MNKISKMIKTLTAGAVNGCGHTGFFPPG